MDFYMRFAERNLRRIVKAGQESGNEHLKHTVGKIAELLGSSIEAGRYVRMTELAAVAANQRLAMAQVAARGANKELALAVQRLSGSALEAVDKACDELHAMG